MISASYTGVMLRSALRIVQWGLWILFLPLILQWSLLQRMLSWSRKGTHDTEEKQQQHPFGVRVHKLVQTKHFRDLEKHLDDTIRLATSNTATSESDSYHTADILLRVLNEVSELIERQLVRIDLHSETDLSSLLGQIQTLMTQTMSDLASIRAGIVNYKLQLHSRLRNELRENPSLTKVLLFEDFFRGLFLTILHEADELYDLLLSLPRLRYSTLLSTLQCYRNKLFTLCAMTERGSEMMSQSSHIRSGSLCTILTDLPSDVTPEMKKKLYLADFCLAPGSQFASKARLFYGFWTGVIASVHSALSWMRLHYLEWKPQPRCTGPQEIALWGYQFYYTFNKKKAAEKCAEFLLEGADIHSCRMIWNLKRCSHIMSSLCKLSYPTVKISKLVHIGLWRNNNNNNNNNNSRKPQEQYAPPPPPPPGGSSTTTTTATITRTTQLQLGYDGQVSMEVFRWYSRQLDRSLESRAQSPPVAEYLVKIKVISAADHMMDQFFNPTIGDSLSHKVVEEVETVLEKIAAGLRRAWDQLLQTTSRTPGGSSGGGGGASASPGGGAVIMHVHGGGFIAMDPFSHEGYIRRWAHQLQVPIVSVDYRKSPECRFPAALEDCYSVYRWILKHGNKLVGGNPHEAPKKIILVGDSSGGNLCTGVVLKAIADGVRIPDALALVYPATYIANAHSPSRVLTLTDAMINYAFLKVCMDAYVSHLKGEGCNNPFISPAIAPDQALAQFPPTYISVGSLDPLFDDSMYLAKRLAKNNPDDPTKLCLDVWDGLSHGYINTFELAPFCDDVTRRAVDAVAEWLQQFM